MNAYAAKHGKPITIEGEVVKNPAAVERVRQKLAEFRLQHAEFKRQQQRNHKSEMPLTPDQADMYRKILALPDAGELTFEQRQYRSKIETKLEAGQ